MKYSNGNGNGKAIGGISLESVMGEIENGLHQLGQKDIKTVTSDLLAKITAEISEDPIASVRAALLMGAGLGAMRGEAAKRALLVGVKLISLKLLSQATASTAASAAQEYGNEH